MFRGLRQLTLALIRERRVVMRVREVGLQLDGPREARDRRAPVARLGGGEAELILRERVAAVGFDGAARQFDGAAGIVARSALRPIRRSSATTGCRWSRSRVISATARSLRSSFSSDCAARNVDAGSPSRAASTACSYEPD